MTAPAVGQRVRLAVVTAPVWVQVSLKDVTGVVVTDAYQNLHGQLVAVKLDPLPTVYGKLRKLGMVSEEDEVVLVWPDEVEDGTAESAKSAEKAESAEKTEGKG